MPFNVEQAFIDARINFKKRKTKYQGQPCTQLELKKCLFDESHINNDACIFQYESGAWTFKCQHNSCKDKNTKDVREKLKSDYNLDLRKYWSEQSAKKASAMDKGTISHLSFQEIYNNPVQLEYIINGMMIKGDSVLIHAPGGLGKSMFWIYLVLVLASVDEMNVFNYIFDDFIISKKCSSLIIQSENGRATLYSRINSMCRGLESLKEGLGNVFTLCRHDDVTITGETFTDEEFRDFLVDYIKQIETKHSIKIDLLVIDPLISYHSGSENDSVETRAVLDGIDEVTKRAKCTVIVIHHARKDSNEYRGSTAINDWTRNRISLKKEYIAEDRITDVDVNGKPTEKRIANIPVIRVTHEKCNNFQMFDPFLLRMTNHLHFERVEEQMTPEEVGIANTVAQALKDMGGHAESTNALSKVYQELAAKSTTTAKRHISIAVDNNFIKRESVIKDGKQTYEYSES